MGKSAMSADRLKPLNIGSQRKAIWGCVSRDKKNAHRIRNHRSKSKHVRQNGPIQKRDTNADSLLFATNRRSIILNGKTAGTRLF